jgi:hypothetical protein
VSAQQQGAYHRWLQEHGLTERTEKSRATVIAEADRYDELGDRKWDNRKHSPTARDQAKAEDRADRFWSLADELRGSLPTPTNPCPGGCGYPAQPYGDPCPNCQRTTDPREG